jgi:3-oxoacyl-[acyl-carrier-protein] synthase-1
MGGFIMTAVIAAACTFPSGPTLALADVAHSLHFSLTRKHPQWTDRCRMSIKACYFPEITSAPLDERFRLLLRQVLMELMDTLPGLMQVPPAQVGLLLPPQNRPGINPALAQVAKETVVESTGWYNCPVTVLHGGRAETITLMKTLAETPLPGGTVSVLLAVDSWLSPPALKWLEDEHLLHGAHRLYNRNAREAPYGRVPSEGAAALVIASSSGKYAPWCHIRGTGQATENVRYSDKGVCLGAGLREAAFQALETAKITSLHHIVSDANGEPYRADELGFTLAALGEYTDEEAIRETPVLASGDLGCASLLTHMALTAWRLRTSKQPGDTLLLSSSDDGHRGAIVISG